MKRVTINLPGRINNLFYKASNWNHFTQEFKYYRNRISAGKKILIATSVGGYETITSIESLLGVALTLRGAEVNFLLCDKFLPACLQATITSFKNQKEFPEYGPQKSLCDKCFKAGIDMYKPLNLPIHLYSQFINHKDEIAAYNIAESIKRDEISRYIFDKIRVGEHAYAGALRYFARAAIQGEEYSDRVLRRYLFAALLTKLVTKRLLKAYEFDCLVFNHGIYIPQGITGEVARKLGVRVVNWNPAYKKQCFIFSHNDTYHHTLMTEATSKWENIKWTKKLENATMKYLKSRWYGTQDWIWFHENPQFKFVDIQKEYGIKSDKPLIGMLTNVMWDAQLHYPANAFANMLEWIITTIKYFQKKPKLQLIIRIHPAEIRGTIPSRQRVLEEIKKAFPKLAPNIFVIPPESNTSTYTVMEKCNAVLIYGTKTGVELTSLGIPVIVAGEAWVRNKGITHDATSKIDYYNLLDQLPFASKMKDQLVKRARKYAFHFFFRRMIPLKMVKPIAGWPPYRLNVKSLTDLLPGKDQGLDIICDGILYNKDFIYPYEKFLV